MKKRVRKILDGAGMVYYFPPQMGGWGRSGVPDIVGCYKSTFFGIECKAKGNKPTSLQELNLQAITDAGGFAIIINETEGWDELQAFLNG